MATEKRVTARSRLVTELAHEILSREESVAFPISSEHELSARFNLSRVTVRLALSDLESRGLIYRRQGKGTFAHGRSSRPTKTIAVLLKSQPNQEHWPIAEMVRGIQKALSGQRISMLTVSTSPKEWSCEMMQGLSGVIVFPFGITQEDLDDLNYRKLPFILAEETSTLSGPKISLGQEQAAYKITEDLLSRGHRQIALLTGFEPSLDEVKRRGVHRAMSEASVDPSEVPEVSADFNKDGGLEAVISILNLQPRPTAVIAFDDGLAALLCAKARQSMNLAVPRDISITSFHDSPYLRYLEPKLTTVRFDFFGAGSAAALTLSNTALTGEKIEDVCLEPVYCAGATVSD